MLITKWKMNFDTHMGLDCTVPCDMYSVLEQHGIIDDPYYADNEKILCPASYNDTTFFAEFTLCEKELSKKHIDLIFYGLDTICKIYLNGTLLDSVKNMHRKYEYDVKNIAREKNELRLEFSSPIKYFEEKEREHHLYMNGDTLPGASHLRKAFYMSGWDWAPMLPNMGIFRPVEINAYDTDKISDVYVVQNHSPSGVNLKITADTKHFSPAVHFVCEIDNTSVTLENGQGKIKINSPRLWWPNGYGEQYLYTLKVYLYEGNEIIDTKEMKIGLRTLYLSRKKDKEGEEFCFSVNGIKIFAMGANFVPIDSLLSRRTDERLETLIKSCIDANFNSIRVWGGAFYPDDSFYELCDKYGLIVWQDFMVACANIRLTEEFTNEFVNEAIYNVKRIRNHACLGLLCGNNEMEEAICFWECADGNDPLVREDYLKLYEDILPRICQEYAPRISYIPSSPTSFDSLVDPRNHTVGDVHFWDVWNGNCEFDEYRRHKFRFCSEYGFESLPCMKTIEDFCPKDEQNPLSYTMELHQKHWHGNIKLVRYLAEAYQLPCDLKATVYASQLNQANAIKYGVEHFRRNRGYTMGSIYWQLNDCWPVASWSSIDYYGRYKALHYFAKKFYQGVALGLFNEEESITVNVANETMSAFTGYIKLGACNTDFTPIFEKEIPVCVNSLSSLDAITLPNYTFKGSRLTFFYAELYAQDGTLLARNTELGVKPKHFIFKNPEIKVSAKKTDEGVWLSVSSSALAKNVEIDFDGVDIVLSDNYFDLINTEPYRVLAKTDLSPEELLKKIQIMSVYDIPRRRK